MGSVRRHLDEQWLRTRPPRRRARLPSPSAVREVARLDPATLLRLGSPTRLASIGRLADGERLIGLLMIRNENDVLAEALTSMVPYFDRILVLDGTDAGSARDECHGILADFDEVVAVFTDDDVPTAPLIRDGARQLLLDEARRRYGTDHWVGILHGDELHVRDPRPVLASLHPATSPCARVRTAHFFLHPDDPRDVDASAPILERRLHYMFPGVPETRYFFDSGTRDYDWNLHSKVVPRSLRTGPLIDGLVVAHVNFRSVDQARARAADRIGSGWQGAHYRPVLEHDHVIGPTLHVADYPDFDAEHIDPLHGRARPVHVADAPIAPLLGCTPILIGGTGRCGSTLLRELVGRHPAVAEFPHELKVLSWPAGLVDLVEQPSKRKALRLAARLLDQRPMLGPDFEGGRTTNWGHRSNAGRPPFPGYDDAVRLLCRVLSSARTTQLQRETAAREFVGLLAAHVVGRSSATHWVDQTPANSEVAPGLAQLLPQAHHVHIVRDPRAVVASLLTMTWGPTTVEEAIDHIERVHRRWEPFAGDPRAHTLRLEDLLADPEREMGGLFERLGLVGSADTEIGAPERSPVSASALDAGDIAQIERRLGWVLERYDYA